MNPSAEYQIIASAIDNAQVSDAQEQVLLDAFRLVSDMAVAVERERCAKVAEDWPIPASPASIAERIRSGQ
jgi:hypothetical protein